MPFIPIRGVGQLGVVPDVSPQDLPWRAWNDARNVRFSEGKLSRYSFFKRLDDAYDYGSKVPVGIFDGGAPGDEGYVVTVFNDGTMEQRHSGVTTNVTPAGPLSNNQEQITASRLGGINYVNRPGDVPFYREFPADGAFLPIPGWDPLDSASSVRTFKDFVIALDVTKGLTRFPAMVKWSDATQVGAPPSNWSVTDPASLAGENVINEVRDVLIDGAPLGDSFIIYGGTQTFRMDFIGTPFVFRFLKVFDDQGIMARNCAVEVDGKHYVFGRSDIYVHDGTVKQSISNGLVQRRLFTELDFDKRDRCFVYHDAFNGEIGFAYPSSDDTASWKIADVTGCNRAAVYNYRHNTWTIVDLPSVVGWTETSQATNISWENIADAPWGDSGASWSSFAGRKPRNILLSGSGNPAISKNGQPYFLDGISNARLTNTIDPEVTWEAFAEARHKDLDELQLDIYGRKMVRRLVPQFRTASPGDTVRMAVGRSRNITDEVTYDPMKVFSPWTEAKYDCRISGRYLSIRFEIPAGVDAEIGGYDIDIIRIAGR